MPTRLVEWWRNFAEARGDAAALSVLDRVDEVALADGLPDAVVYGDPSPEVHDADGRLALIDWGTPSWGPLAYDVGAWLAWIRRSGAVAGYEASFLGAYAKHRPIARAERGLLPSFPLLAESIAAPPESTQGLVPDSKPPLTMSSVCASPVIKEPKSNTATASTT